MGMQLFSNTISKFEVPVVPLHEIVINIPPSENQHYKRYLRVSVTKSEIPQWSINSLI